MLGSINFYGPAKMVERKLPIIAQAFLTRYRADIGNTLIDRSASTGPNSRLSMALSARKDQFKRAKYSDFAITAKAGCRVLLNSPTGIFSVT